MRLVARLEGMIADPVYEGTSMAGLIDLVARGEIDRDSNVLYAHLGGQPALNACASLVTNGQGGGIRPQGPAAGMPGTIGCGDVHDDEDPCSPPRSRPAS